MTSTQSGLRSLAAFAGLAILSSTAHGAAADLPAVKTSADNPVMACATPGRLQAYLKARNDKLDPRFDEIATQYMRHGEALGMRWDYAFFQMIVETGSLKFGGDVRPAQNNFAGLGATGNGEHGESFPDVSTGVRAHLEHLLMYSGEKVENPVAERTRKVQEWGVLTAWQKTLKGPLTFAQLARKWAPPARKYGADIEQVADGFIEGPCKAPDPRPELVASARSGLLAAATAPVAPPTAPAAAAAAAADTSKAASATPSPAKTEPAGKVSGTELARRAVEDAKADGLPQRSALGAGAAAKAIAPDAAKDGKEPPKYALVNPPAPEPPANEAAAAKTSATAAAKATKPTAPAHEACKVFTASYGGAKSVIIKVATGDTTAYTVLDVNEGAEQRETGAYIAAYAPGGKQVGEFKNSATALDKAFELCPEG